jgi:hypothetical protein
MTDFFRRLISEPSASTPEDYSRRVYGLAVIYFTLFTVSIVGLILLTWKGQFFVTLAQRSNVETLVLLFFLVFFGYIALISWSGALGAVRLFWHNLSGLFQREWVQADRNKMNAIGPSKGKTLGAALNIRVHSDKEPDGVIELPVRDEAGQMGILRIDGARCTFEPEFDHTSNNIFAFLEYQLNEILKERGDEQNAVVIGWKTIDDETTESFLAMVRFARNLERALGADELWPKMQLSQTEFRRLEEKFSRICRPLRNECFLPDWEYTAEHKVPIIPEPLGLFTISRSERRADPLASMGVAAGVVVLSVGVLAVFILFPPWVPG